MQVQNKPLYDACNTVFGGCVDVNSQGKVANFTVPSTVDTGFDISKENIFGTRGTLVRAMLQKKGWGEIIAINCPCCGDTRGRLNISHMSMVDVLKPGTKGCYIHFGLNAHCFNEGCEKYKAADFKKKVRDPLWKALGNSYIQAASFEDLWGSIPKPGGVKLKKVGYDSRTVSRSAEEDAVQLPKPIVPITSPVVPASVITYLRDERKFDIEELYSEYGILFSFKGSEYAKDADGKPICLFDNRIIAPIFQNDRYAGWQGRGEKGRKPKYFFPGGCQKSEWIYNKDEAKFHRNILITEGCTNVWAFGSNKEKDWSSVASFGKFISPEQMDAMACLFDFDCIGVLCLDPDAAHHLPETVEDMLKRQCFGKGMAVIVLEKGMDVADMYATGRGSEFENLFEAALARASFDKDVILAGLDGRIAEAAEEERRKAEAAKKKRDPFARDML